MPCWDLLLTSQFSAWPPAVIPLTDKAHSLCKKRQSSSSWQDVSHSGCSSDPLQGQLAESCFIRRLTPGCFSCRWLVSSAFCSYVPCRRVFRCQDVLSCTARRICATPS